MMNFLKTCILAGFFLSTLSHAASLAGKWTAEFDSQIGVQKYSYEFKIEDEKITGKAAFEHSMGKGETALKNIKLAGEDISFVEPFKFDGNEIAITYTGKITGDEIKLTRNVGDFATEQIVAKRLKAPVSKPVVAK